MSNRLVRILWVSSTVLFCANSQVSYKISTFAGNNTNGFSGDGSTATSAELAIPAHIAVDSSGNLYIADQGNSRIRQVASGTINTKAGSSTTGYAGDGKAATSASLLHPNGVAVDSSGNIYISDTENQVIRKVVSGGNISTIAGSNTTGAGFSGDGSTATNGQINRPMGITVDSSGNVYFADTGNHRIRKITSGGTISTFAGNGLVGPYGDGGQATAATLYSPQGVSVDAAGNLYIADTGNHKIRKVAVDGTITTVAGNGTAGFSGDGGLATDAMLNSPREAVADAAGNVYVADYYNSRIRRVGTDGIITTIAGNGQFNYYGDGYIATAAALKFPSGLAIDSAGNIYISDTQNDVIRMLTPAASAPVINTAGVTGAAAYGAFKAVAPGSWIEIYGTNLAAKARSWTAADFTGSSAPTSLEGTTVTIGGHYAYVSYISPTQVNVQVPSDVPTGSQPLLLNTATGSSLAYPLVVNPTQPGLLAPAAFTSGGKQYAAAIFPDGTTYAMPAGAVAGVTSRPAHAGDTLLLFGIGFGPVTPGAAPGQVTPAANSLANSISFSFGDSAAAVSYAGLAPGVLGLYQFNVVVPAVAPGSAVPLTFKLAGQAGTQVLYTAVE